jgi:RNA 3'-terminal phosphate cyclase (ATP)
MYDVVIIDGSMGEGGGQILRTSLSLAAITKCELSLKDIRARREKPGLKRQHLTCVSAVAEICDAEVSDITVGSRELEFAPRAIKAGDYRFDVGTAGSVTLVAQTIIPVLLKADGVSTVTITGGTHVPFAPTWEFFELCYLPELRRMGAEVEAKLETPGFYPAAGGVVKLKIKPFDASHRVDSYEFMSLGDLKGGSVVGVVSALPRSIAEAEVGIVASKFRELKLKHEVREVESFGPGNYCYVQLDYDRASVVISSIGTYNRSRKAVANDVVQRVNEFLKSARACEKHLADQLLVPLNIFVGGDYHWETDGLWEDNVWRPNWFVDTQQETQHYKTNNEVIDRFARRLRD